MMATLDVMQRAAAAGRNLVITHEPTFYSHQDSIDQLKDDGIVSAAMNQPQLIQLGLRLLF